LAPRGRLAFNSICPYETQEGKSEVDFSIC
jgi:hypothetical protein